MHGNHLVGRVKRNITGRKKKDVLRISAAFTAASNLIALALPSGLKDITHAATNITVDMRSTSVMTRVGVRRAMEGADMVVKVSNETIEELPKYVGETEAEDTPRALALLGKFNFKSLFEGIKSNQGQISAVVKYFHFNKPETVSINA